MLRWTLPLCLALVATVTRAEVIDLTPQPMTDWKAVYGEVEPRDLIPARARIGGTVVELLVTEGDEVGEGQRIAVVEDDKLNFQLDSIDAQMSALETQLATAEADLERGLSLRERGVITVQRLDQLQTAVDVLESQIKSIAANRLVLEQQVAEGEVLSPVAGVVLDVPLARGSVITPGEVVAQIGGGGVFLRLALPERHAGSLTVGQTIVVDTASGGGGEGRLVKIYPQIEGGRVLADVEVAGLDGRFIGRRVPVRLPVGSHPALLVPQAALSHEEGLDFVTVESNGQQVQRTVVPGRAVEIEGRQWREILTGLRAGEKVIAPDE